MKRLGLWTVVVAILLSGGAAWGDEVYVIAGGRGVGTRITSVPYEIKNPGFYYLGTNLTYSGSGNAININADDVTLDLMGFSLTFAGTPVILDNNGIYIMGSKGNVEIRNGTVRGFDRGIYKTGGRSTRIINIRAIDNLTQGICLNSNANLVQGCFLENNGGGIYNSSGTITGCIAHNSGDIMLPDTYGIVIGNVVSNDNNPGTYGFVLGFGNIVVDRNCAAFNETNYLGGPTNPAYWGINAGH
jgi:hypothetical protein